MIYPIGMFPRCIAVVLLAFALTSIGICVPKSHSKPTSGIKGKVALTGNCPGPQRIGESCPPRPYEGKLAIRNASDQQVVTTTKTDSKGEFKVAVPPGKYVITQPPETRYPLIHSAEVVVEKNKITTVQIQGDLGMR